jgi:flagellar FliL protein
MAREDKKSVAEAPAAKPKKKLLIIAVAAVILSASAGGAAWYFMKGKPSGDEQKSTASSTLTPIFIPIDPFTVNLQREDGDRVLQVGLSFKIYNADLQEKLKAAMPEIRSNLLLLLSSKHASELVTVDGKVKLANEIIVAVDNILGIRPPVARPVTAVSPAKAPEPATPVPAGDQASAPAAGSAPAQPAAVADAAPAPAPSQEPPAAAPATDVAAEAKPGTEPREGIVGVLFTSFIIQ